MLQQSVPRHGLEPSWPLVITGICAFVLQYAASGALELPLLHQNTVGLPLTLDTVLCGTALLHWYGFDRSPQGRLYSLSNTCSVMLDFTRQVQADQSNLDLYQSHNARCWKLLS